MLDKLNQMAMIIVTFQSSSKGEITLDGISSLEFELRKNHTAAGWISREIQERAAASRLFVDELYKKSVRRPRIPVFREISIQPQCDFYAVQTPAMKLHPV
eukprot:sb/3478474/